MNEKVYTTEELTEILGYKNKETVLRKLRNGKIKGIKLGNEWRVTQGELDRIFKEGY